MALLIATLIESDLFIRDSFWNSIPACYCYRTNTFKGSRCLYKLIRCSFFFPLFLFQVRANQKQLQLSWEIDENVPEHLVGDAARLQQCLINLGTYFLPLSSHNILF